MKRIDIFCNRLLILGFILFLFSGYPLVTVYSEQSGNMEKKKDEKENQLKEWRDTLKYGIDTEVLDVIRKIKESKETALDKDMLSVLEETVNSDVRKAIIEIFSERKNLAAYGTVVGILQDFDEETDDLLIASLNYIKSVSGKIKKEKLGDLREILREIVENGNKNIAPLAVKTIASVGDKEVEDFLLEKYGADDTPQSLKNAIVLGLGQMKSTKALPTIIKAAEDTDNPRILRMYACEALGNIGDRSAIKTLKKILTEKDALLRVYAASAISKFQQDEETIKLLMNGLRDSNWRVRVQCAKALGDGKAKEAVDILEYKVLHDPVKQVRKESVSALGKIGTKGSFAFLREVFENSKRDEYTRLQALGVLVRSDFKNSIDVIKKVIRNSDRRAYKKFLENIAKTVSQQKNGASKELLRLLLNDTDPVIRIYAMRGIKLNSFTDMKALIKRISENDESDIVKREASRILETFKESSK